MRIITVVLFATAAVCGYFFVREYKTAQNEISEYSNIRNDYTAIINEQTNEPDRNDIQGEIPSETAGLPYFSVDFNALLHINPDTVGWVAIPNTDISYPVVQGVDNIKYLNTSFEGNHSRTGTPFADMRNDIQPLDRNTIIHGHNMGIGRTDMFSNLLLYKDFEHYSAHRYIQFDTIYERHGFWKVFAVIELDSRNAGFNHQQIHFTDEADFMAWIETVTELSIHASDVDITPQDYILTLSTCDRSTYGRSGRLLVLAVRI